MKKREMINKIAEVIADFKGPHGPSMNDMYVAAAILRKIEGLGMLPPAALIKTNTDNPNYPELRDLKEWSHEWETEDET